MSGYQKVDIGVFSLISKISKITIKLYDTIDQNLTSVRRLSNAIKRVPACNFDYMPVFTTVTPFSVCILLGLAILGF
jgi:hypothetical protein